MDWTLALAQDAVQQEGEQMAPMMCHQISLQSKLFISDMFHAPADCPLFQSIPLMHVLAAFQTAFHAAAHTQTQHALTQHTI